MPEYKKKKWNIYSPENKEPYRLSRSKIDLFVQCPRCFYLDIRCGVSRPQFPAFTLNNAVDKLMKKEFDIHRINQTQHPLMKAYNIDAVPFAHEKMDEWRDALRNGISFLHKPTNLILRGGIDDAWKDKNGKIIIVDYKATSKDEEITLDDKWKEGYKRQMEIYQWLFKQNGFDVSDTGYFVYVNGKTDKEAFDGKLEFDVQIIPYKGNDSWIEKVIFDMKECMNLENAPEPAGDCEYCGYREEAGKILQKLAIENKKKTVKQPKLI